MPGTWATLKVPREVWNQWTRLEDRIAVILNMDPERKETRIEVFEALVAAALLLPEADLETFIQGKES